MKVANRIRGKLVHDDSTPERDWHRTVKVTQPTIDALRAFLREHTTLDAKGVEGVLIEVGLVDPPAPPPLPPPREVSVLKLHLARMRVERYGQFPGRLTAAQIDEAFEHFGLTPPDGWSTDD